MLTLPPVLRSPCKLGVHNNSIMATLTAKFYRRSQTSGEIQRPRPRALDRHTSYHHKGKAPFQNLSCHGHRHALWPRNAKWTQAYDPINPFQPYHALQKINSGLRRRC